jgi:O-succinylbenzoic acid--CoA ligase
LKSPIEIELPKLNLSLEESEKWKLFYTDKVNNTSEKWLKDIWNFLLNWVSDKKAIALKTSGSTGEPKSISVEKATMIFSAQQTSDYFQFKRNEKWLLCLPAEFIGGQMILVRAILNESKVFAAEPKIELKELVGEYDFASMIPMQVEKWIESETNLSFNKILIGGSGISKQLERRISRINQSEFYVSYGMTETVSHIALRKVNGVSNSDYYTPFKNILIATDDRNCLTIYHKNYSENVLITNDIVEFNSKNEFKVIGRADSIINSGGLKVVPEEIEKLISEILTERIMVIGIPDETLGEKLILLIEGTELDKTTLMILKNHLTESLDKNKVPKEIFFIDKLEETNNGKLDRKRTKESYLKNLRTIL